MKEIVKAPRSSTPRRDLRKTGAQRDRGDLPRSGLKRKNHTSVDEERRVREGLRRESLDARGRARPRRRFRDCSDDGHGRGALHEVLRAAALAEAPRERAREAPRRGDARY